MLAHSHTRRFLTRRRWLALSTVLGLIGAVTVFYAAWHYATTGENLGLLGVGGLGFLAAGASGKFILLYRNRPANEPR